MNIIFRNTLTGHTVAIWQFNNKMSDIPRIADCRNDSDIRVVIATSPPMFF